MPESEAWLDDNWQRMGFGTVQVSGRWWSFTGDELSDIHNALVHAREGTGTAPSLIAEIRREWERRDSA